MVFFSNSVHLNAKIINLLFTMPLFYKQYLINFKNQEHTLVLTSSQRIIFPSLNISAAPASVTGCRPKPYTVLWLLKRTESDCQIKSYVMSDLSAPDSLHPENDFHFKQTWTRFERENFKFYFSIFNYYIISKKYVSKAL